LELAIAQFSEVPVDGDFNTDPFECNYFVQEKKVWFNQISGPSSSSIGKMPTCLCLTMGGITRNATPDQDRRHASAPDEATRNRMTD
jgi:hypothetical protein